MSFLGPPSSSLDSSVLPMDWKSPDHYFEDCSSILAVDERQEIDRIVGQQRFRIAKAERRRLFQEELKRQEEEFEYEEADRDSDLFHTVAHEILDRGIQDVRNTIIPPYAFDYFPRLPLELQLRIWELATELGGFMDYSLLPMNSFLSEDDGETQIYDPRPGVEQRLPAIYHVCEASRAVATSRYMPMSCRPRNTITRASREMPLCCNPSLTNFYIGGGYNTWKDYKILIAILIQGNTTRPLPASMQRDLVLFRGIKYLTIDFAVFAGAPKLLWSHFSDLKVLTITFYTAETIQDESDSSYELIGRPQYKRPQPGTKFGKRAEWIENTVATMLEKILNVSARKFKLEAVVRGVVHRGVIQDLESSLDEERQLRALHGEEEWTPPDDTQWYTQAERFLSTPALTKADISKLKHKYHPSRTMDMHDYIHSIAERNFGKREGTKQENEERPKPRALGQYYTDSEHESGTNKY